MIKRSIYAIVFDKRVQPNGDLKVTSYEVGKTSSYDFKIPVSIVLKDEKYFVTFEDGCRHVIPNSDKIEYK